MRHDPLPPPAALLADSAFALGRRIQAREVSARAVVAAHIERARQVNGAINALVADRFEAALTEADAVDAAIAAGEPVGPLAGVPFSAKEMIDVEGMPSTFGARSRHGRRALCDATAVARLRTTGAIPIGVTNVPEWGMWFETHNLVYGRTSNPHDVRHTPGGSSGGEAALVAAGGAAFGLGSDIGGSIRMPAAFCGLPAHKPSPGIVPLTGHYPVYRDGPDADISKRAPCLVIGPIARSARDLLPLLRLLSGPDGVDPNARAAVAAALAAGGGAGDVDWRGRRVLLLEDPRFRMAARADADARRGVHAAADHMRAAGAEIVPVPADLFRETVELWAAALHAGSDRTLGEAAGLRGWSAIARTVGGAAVGRGDVSTPLLMFLAGEWLGRLRLRDLDTMMDRLVALAARFDALVGVDGVLLLPAHPRTAPRHGAPLRRPFDFAYTAIFNALRVPATVVPVGRSAAGLPVGVQFAARRGNDALTIAAAVVIEAASARFAPVTPRASGPAGARRPIFRHLPLTAVEATATPSDA